MCGEVFRTDVVGPADETVDVAKGGDVCSVGVDGVGGGGGQGTEEQVEDFLPVGWVGVVDEVGAEGRQGRLGVCVFGEGGGLFGGGGDGVFDGGACGQVGDVLGEGEGEGLEEVDDLLGGLDSGGW